MKTKSSRPSVLKGMLIAIVILFLCSGLSTPKSIQAAPNAVTGPGWVVVASQDTVVDENLEDLYYNAIYMMNTYTNEVHGPFLMDELTPLDIADRPMGRDVFDVAITPDGKTALISSFGNKLIYFVDITDPLEPVYLSSVKIDIFAEDLAITADGLYALVTDGGFSKSVYSIDIRARTLAHELVLPTIDHSPDGVPVYGLTNAVAIASDGTALMADYFNGAIHSLLIGRNGTLSYFGTHRYYVSIDGEISLTPKTDYQMMRPVNVAIAPDGKTVLVSDSLNYVDTTLPQYERQFGVGVYEITVPGEVEFVKVIKGLSHCMQTITFTEAGDKAVMLGNNAMTYDETADPQNVEINDGLYVMDILGPGEVEINPSQSVDLLRFTSSQLFGVDGLAVYEGKAYASYPTLSINSDLYPERFVSVVDLNTFKLTQVDWGLVTAKTPVGLAVRPFIPFRVNLPLISK